MKAITLLHPWPFAICYLGKDVENRGWKPTPGQLKPGQRFAIHGAATPVGKFWRAAEEWRLEILAKHGIPGGTPLLEMVQKCQGIVATVELAWLHSANPYHATPACSSPWRDESGWGWCLRGLLVLPDPIPCKGRQGLWNVPPDILERLPK